MLSGTVSKWRRRWRTLFPQLHNRFKSYAIWYCGQLTPPDCVPSTDRLFFMFRILPKPYSFKRIGLMFFRLFFLHYVRFFKEYPNRVFIRVVSPDAQFWFSGAWATSFLFTKYSIANFFVFVNTDFDFFWFRWSFSVFLLYFILKQSTRLVNTAQKVFNKLFNINSRYQHFAFFYLIN